MVPNESILYKNKSEHSRLVNLFEYVLEATVVTFENRVLCAHVQRPLLLDRKLEAAVCEAIDRLKERRTNEARGKALLLQSSFKETVSLETAHI